MQRGILPYRIVIEMAQYARHSTSKGKCLDTVYISHDSWPAGNYCALGIRLSGIWLTQVIVLFLGYLYSVYADYRTIQLRPWTFGLWSYSAVGSTHIATLRTHGLTSSERKCEGLAGKPVGYYVLYMCNRFGAVITFGSGVDLQHAVVRLYILNVWRRHVIIWIYWKCIIWNEE